MAGPLSPLPPGELVRWRSSYPLPSVPADKEIVKEKRNEKRKTPPTPPRRELPNVRGRKEVHHRLVTYLHGKQLRYLHLPTPARFPARCLPHLLPELPLLVFPPAAVTEDMLPRLGHRPSAPTVHVYPYPAITPQQL
jgi:hypothetical protein